MKRETSLTEADVATVLNALADEHSKMLEATQGHRTFERLQRTVNDSRRVRMPARRVAVLTVAPAVAAAAITLGVTSWLTPTPLSFEVQGAVVENGIIEAGSEPAVLQFSDESRVVAQPQSALSMSLVGEHGALARLREGGLSVKVEHAETTDWRFLAGPYEVRVVGTQFDLTWQPEISELSVLMHEGQVRVVGPEKVETVLNAGDSKTFGRAPEVEVEAVAGDEAEQDSGAAVQPEASSQAARPHRAVVGKPSPVKPQNWAALVGKGRFTEVVEEAERLGIDTALGSRSSRDLQALAQAAHYTGRGSLALKTWSVVRQRFGSQQSGKQAAFFMGRIYDQQGSAQHALRWLDVYLSEAGAGVYASEALGRKLTLVQRLHGKTPAEKVAREYLQRFPKGAYARTARALLGK